MISRLLKGFVLIGLPLALAVSEYSYLQTFGCQYAGWTLHCRQGRVTLSKWASGRDKEFNAPGGDSYIMTIPKAADRYFRGAPEVALLDQANTILLKSTLAASRLDAHADQPPQALKWQPFDPPQRATLWVSVTPEQRRQLDVYVAELKTLSIGRVFSFRGDRTDVRFQTPCTLGPVSPVHAVQAMRMSIWWILLLFVLLTCALGARWFSRLLQAARRERHGMCLQCAYDLRGSKTRCPECNAPFPSGASLRRLRVVRWTFKLGLTVCLAVMLGAMGMSYFGFTFQQGRTRVMLWSASLHLRSTRHAAPQPRAYYHRAFLPRNYDYLPKCRLKPLRLVFPMWIPIVSLILMLYWLDIRPRRRAVVQPPPIPAGLLPPD